MLKDTKFREILQGSAMGYQVFQLLRYAAILAGAVALSWIDPSKAIINQFETLLLLSSSFTFFWVSGLLDGYLVVFKSLPLHARSDMDRSAKSFMVLLSVFSALGVLVALLVGKGDMQSSLIFAAMVASETACVAIPYFMLAHARNKGMLFYSLLNALLYLSALLIPIVMGMELKWALAALAIAGLVKLLLFFLPGGFFPQSLQSVKQHAGILAKVALPLMLAALLSQSAVYVDGYLVLTYFPDYFADFKYGARELPFILLLANSLSLVKSGEIADNKADRAQVLGSLKQSAARLAIWGFGISALLMLGSDWIFANVFNHNFEAAVPIFDIYLLLAIPRLVFPQSIVKGLQKTQMLSISAGIELVLNLALSLVFLHFWGMPGIAMATVLAFCVEKLVLVVFLHKKNGINFTSYTPLFKWSLGSLALVLVFVLKYAVFI